MTGPSWTQVEVDPKYRAQPPEMRAAIRQQFFDNVVKPRLTTESPGTDPAQAQRVFQMFTRETPAKHGDDISAALHGDTGDLPGVDYMSGVPFEPLKSFFAADNDRERYDALAQVYGKTNVGIDPGGRWFVRDKDGKLKTVVGFNSIKNFAAETSAQAPELIGMGVGAALAPETEGLSLVPAVERFAAKAGWERGVPFVLRQVGRLQRLGAAAARPTAGAMGSLVGKLGSEQEKAAEGLFDKSAQEEIRALTQSAVSGYLGDLTARGFSAAGRRLFLEPYSTGLPIINAPSSAMEKAMAVRALREGFHPSVGQARGETGGAALWRYGQGLYDLVSGGAQKRQAQNVAAINRKIDGFLDGLGVPQADRAEIKRRIMDKDFAIGDAVQGIGVPAQEDFAKLGKIVDAEVGRAQTALSAETDRIVSSLGHEEHPLLALDAEKAVAQARAKFGNIANARYEEIWTLGGEPGVMAPTGSLKELANSLWAQIAKTAPETESIDVLEPIPGGGQRLTTQQQPTGREGAPVNTKLDAFKSQVRRVLAMPDEIPIQQFSQLRTDFMNAAEDSTLTAGPEKGRYRAMAGRITDIMRLMEGDKGISGEAAKLLRSTNDWYGAEIAKFDAASLIKLSRTAGERGALRAEDIPSSVIQPGYESTMNQVKSVVGQEMFDRIAARRFEDLKSEAIDSATGMLDPKKLSTTLGKFTKDGFARKVWGSEAGAEIDQLQREARLLGDTGIDPATFKPGSIRESIRAAVARKQANDAFWSKNILGELAAGGTKQEAAVNRVAAMQNLSEIRLVKSYLKADPARWQTVQRLAMQKLLGKAVDVADNPFGQALTGKGFLATLTDTGRDKLTEMFGPEMTEDLFNLAEQVRYVTAKNQNVLAGALRAGTLMFHPLSHLPGLIQTNIEGALMMKPGFIKWITYGLEGDGKFANAVASSFKLAAALAGQQLGRAAFPEPQEYNQGP